MISIFTGQTLPYRVRRPTHTATNSNINSSSRWMQRVQTRMPPRRFEQPVRRRLPVQGSSDLPLLRRLRLDEIPLRRSPYQRHPLPCRGETPSAPPGRARHSPCCYLSRISSRGSDLCHPHGHLQTSTCPWSSGMGSALQATAAPLREVRVEAPAHPPSPLLPPFTVGHPAWDRIPTPFTLSREASRPGCMGSAHRESRQRHRQSWDLPFPRRRQGRTAVATLSPLQRRQSV